MGGASLCGDGCLFRCRVGTACTLRRCRLRHRIQRMRPRLRPVAVEPTDSGRHNRAGAADRHGAGPPGGGWVVRAIGLRPFGSVFEVNNGEAGSSMRRGLQRVAGNAPVLARRDSRSTSRTVQSMLPELSARRAWGCGSSRTGGLPGGAPCRTASAVQPLRQHLRSAASCRPARHRSRNGGTRESPGQAGADARPGQPPGIVQVVGTGLGVHLHVDQVVEPNSGNRRIAPISQHGYPLARRLLLAGHIHPGLVYLLAR